jgi:N4-gp56 family major capsid protein
MAETILASASDKQIWINDYMREYVRASGLMPYMSTRQNAIIRVRNELQTTAGSAINVPLIGRLKGSGVTGAQVLEGNEEDLENLNDRVLVDWRRNAVIVPKSTSFRTEMDILGAAKDALVDWEAEKLRDTLLTELGSVIIPGAVDANGIPGTDTSISYAAASAAQRNAFLAANADRILFGSAIGNSSSLNWATSAANVDNTADKLTTGVVSLAKRMARTPSNNQRKIRPYRTDGGAEYYVMFVPSLPFRDLKADTAMQQANRDARAREGNGMDRNPIFQDGDLMWDGVIIREIPELPLGAGVGASSIQTAQSFLCGQSALCVAYGQQPTPKTDPDRDYGFRPGVAVETLVGQKKVSYGGVQYGVVSVITAAVGDA